MKREEAATVDAAKAMPGMSRRRGAVLEQAIFEATWEMLRGGEADRLTMANIAERAGTSKPVLYRRWPSAAELILSTLQHKAPTPEIPDIDHGTLRADIIAIMRAAAGWFTAMPAVVVRTLSAASSANPELRGLLPGRINLVDIRPAMQHALDRATGRGEAPVQPVGDRLLRLPLDLMFLEALNGIPVPNPERFYSEVVDQILVPALRFAKDQA